MALALAAVSGPFGAHRLYPEEPSRHPNELANEVLDELSALRSEVAQIAERLDFAERLLAQPRPAGSDPVSTLKA